VVTETGTTIAKVVGPPHVELLLAFTNSVDREEQTDDITTPAELSAWLRSHVGLARRHRATEPDLELGRRLRDGLREAMRGNHEGGSRVSALKELVDELPLVLDVSAASPGVKPASGGVRGGLAQLMVAVVEAAGDDTWRRTKMCAADSCQWAFYDASKNRSRTWCEWGCGNKEKTRNYRARQKSKATLG